MGASASCVPRERSIDRIEALLIVLGEAAVRQEAASARQVALLEDLTATGRTTAASLEALARADQLRLFERLMIRPTPARPMSRGSPSSSGGASSSRRSPGTADERIELKKAVITYYGLWVNDADGGTSSVQQEGAPPPAAQPSLRSRVYTMLVAPVADGAARPSVSFSDAVLAHIWPSSMKSGAVSVRRLLHLPADFHLDVRNFLILNKSVESAFDADALLLLPARAEQDAPAVVRARTFRLERFRASKEQAVAEVDRSAISALDGLDLFLPCAKDKKLPFLRLLAWKAVSALRAAAEADDDGIAARAEELHRDVVFDASLDIGGTAAVHVHRTVSDLKSAGLIFAGARGAT
jgi:hypothetical protein